MVESGLWFGLAVRQGTPSAVVQRIYTAAVKALNSPDVRDG